MAITNIENTKKETPSVSNGKMISALKDPHFFLEILKLAQNQFPNDEILKIEKRVKELLLNNSCFENKINEFINGEKNYVYNIDNR